jgi:hypothetical protein
MRSELEAFGSSRCRSVNRLGAPCRRLGTRDGYCTVHDPKRPQDMRALGHRGGVESGKVRSAIDLLDDDDASDRLRSKAKIALEAALESENETVRLQAARALYSYRAAAAPDEHQAESPESVNAWQVSLPAVVRVMVDMGALEARGGEILVAGRPLPPAEASNSIERVHADRAALVSDEPPPPLAA